MRTLTAVFLNWLHQLALCLWLGGMLVIGAVAAPAVFGTAKEMGDTKLGTPHYDFAARAMSHAFQQFNYLAVVAGALLLLSGLGYGALAGLCRNRLRARAVLTAIAWGVTLWLTFGLFPQMQQVHAGGDQAAFDAMHKLYKSVSEGQALVLLTVAALTAWMHLDLAPHAPADIAAPVAEPSPVRG